MAGHKKARTTGKFTENFSVNDIREALVKHLGSVKVEGNQFVLQLGLYRFFQSESLNRVAPPLGILIALLAIPKYKLPTIHKAYVAYNRLYQDPTGFFAKFAQIFANHDRRYNKISKQDLIKGLSAEHKYAIYQNPALLKVALPTEADSALVRAIQADITASQAKVAAESALFVSAMPFDAALLSDPVMSGAGAGASTDAGGVPRTVAPTKPAKFDIDAVGFTPEQLAEIGLASPVAPPKPATFDVGAVEFTPEQLAEIGLASPVAAPKPTKPSAVATCSPKAGSPSLPCLTSHKPKPGTSNPFSFTG